MRTQLFMPGFQFVATAIWVTIFSAATALASERVHIPVPKNIIYAGQFVTEDLLRDRSVPVSYVTRVSVYKNNAQVVGKVAKKTLLPNRPIFTNTVVEPNVVEVNRRTVMRYQIQGLYITADVNPLNSAKVGQQVRARNIKTGVVVYGIANHDGTIQVSVRQ